MSAPPGSTTGRLLRPSTRSNDNTEQPAVVVVCSPSSNGRPADSGTAGYSVEITTSQRPPARHPRGTQGGSCARKPGSPPPAGVGDQPRFHQPVFHRHRRLKQILDPGAGIRSREALGGRDHQLQSKWSTRQTPILGRPRQFVQVARIADDEVGTRPGQTRQRAPESRFRHVVGGVADVVLQQVLAGAQPSVHAAAPTVPEQMRVTPEQE